MTASKLAEFADSASLSFSESAALPAAGATLTKPGGKVKGAATGSLPGGIEGTLAHFTYTHESTDSDGHTSTEVRNFTLVVAAIPESIGFIPYLGFVWPKSKLEAAVGSSETVPIDLAKRQGFEGAEARAYQGTSEHWLAQLLSPALVQWLSRSEEDFGFELAEGTLVCGRSGFLAKAEELTALCEDAARLATAIREESVEEVEAGGTKLDAARESVVDPSIEATQAEVAAGAPENLVAAEPTFRAHYVRSAGNYTRALRTGLAWMVILNIPGIALPIVLSVSGEFVILAAIEIAILLVVAVISFRSRLGSSSRENAAEAFYRGYARERGLVLGGPLRFAAEHAEAKLPFKPDRVFTGPLPGGGEGSLVLHGDGAKRSDRVAVVAGPRGPVAESELQAESPGLSARTLDMYLEQLAAEAREDAATAPTTA